MRPPKRGDRPDALPGPRPEPDWASASAFLERRLRRLLPSLDPEAIKDLAQEALIDLVRTQRNQPIRSLEALLNTLARRKAIDHVRRRDRWRRLVSPLEDDGDVAAPPEPGFGDPAERLDFVVLEFLARHGSACETLARQFLAGYTWAEVAASTGRTELAVRKQWSRCAAHLRQILRQDPDALWPWAAARKELEDDGD